MNRILAASLLAASFMMSHAAMAACTMDDAMNKSGAVSEKLMAKVSDKPDAVSKLMTEMGDIMGNGTVTDQTCVKLDALALKAAKI
jgi:hypothetical protein